MGDRIFIIGGWNRSSCLNTVYEADLKSKHLIPKQPMLCSKCLHSLCHLDSFIYSIGGNGNPGYLNDCEKYDIIGNKWSALPGLNTPRNGSAVFTWNHGLFAFCGCNGAYLNSMEQLSLLSCAKWDVVTVTNPPPGRWGVHGISINSGILVFGGYDGDEYIINIVLRMSAIC